MTLKKKLPYLLSLRHLLESIDGYDPLITMWSLDPTIYDVQWEFWISGVK